MIGHRERLGTLTLGEHRPRYTVDYVFGTYFLLGARYGSRGDVVGLLWRYLSRMGLGRLPGDIVIERDNVTFYFPLVTCLLLSLLFSLVYWVVSR